MIRGGLVSITFRKLSPIEIVYLVMKSGLKSIEWGGDVHVPHGNIAGAKNTYQLTVDAGLNVACYGSYYRVGEKAEKENCFESILDTAVALNAPIIRVWAGTRPSKNADTEYRKTVIEESLRIAALAATANIKLSYEYHNNTLTDEPESIRTLMQEVSHPNIYFHWQPNPNRDSENAVLELKEVLPRLSIMHVYKWKMIKDQLIRQPLADGALEWSEYFKIANSKDQTTDALIEFVKDDSPEQFLEDAKTLKDWINEE